MLEPDGKTRIQKEKIGDVAKEEKDRKLLEKIYKELASAKNY